MASLDSRTAMTLLELETIPEEEPDTFEAPHVANMKKREKRGAPKVTAKPLDEAVHQGYDERQAHAFEAFNKYCERVMSDRSLEMFIEESYVAREGKLYVMELSDAARMTFSDLEQCIGAFIASRSHVASAFARREPSRWGVPRDALQFELRLKSGRKVFTVLRDVLTDAEALSGFYEWRIAHDEYGTPWTQGCEADGLPDSRRIQGAIKTAAYASGSRMVEGFTIGELAPRSGSVNNELCATYYKMNKKGKILSRTRQMSNPIDRYKWGTKELRDELGPYTCATKLYDKLRDIYAEHVPAWLMSYGFPTDVQNGFDLRRHLVATSLVTNEGSSRASIHRDPLCPLPAMICGLRQYLWDANAQAWARQGAKARFFLADGAVPLELTPRDVLLIDGHFAHGVELFADARGGESVKRREFERFTVVLFSTWDRMPGSIPISEPEHMYAGTWDEEMRASVPWLPAVEEQRRAGASVEAAMGKRRSVPPVRLVDS
jgi:hypothetical protein